jgi:hypothetical protein
MEKKHNKKMYHEILIMLGALIIFCSWIVQNFIENSYKMQREDIEREKGLINELVNYASQYDPKSEESDTAKIALFRRNYIRPVLTLFNISKKYWIDTAKAEKLKRKTDSLNVEEMYKKGLYNDLNAEVAKIKKVREENEFGVIIGFYDHYKEICEKEKTSNRIFVIIYATGAIVSGAGMYLKKKKEMKENNSA